MSKLERLIAELCPDGVELVKLSDVAPPTRGVRVIKSQLALEDKYPVYQNSMTPLGYYKESNCHANTVFIISAGAAGEIGYSTGAFWAADDCFYFICPQKLKSRFLYYTLMCQREHLLSRVRRASVPRLARSVIDGLDIPIPPLPVQEEIVRILDNFTELTAELTAELTDRKKQYEYYRDSLLTFGDEVSIVTLGEIATIIRGGNFQKKDFRENGVPCIHYGQIYTKYGLSTIDTLTFIEKSVAEKSKFAQKNDIVMAVTSENVEDVCKCVVWLGEEDVAISGHTAIIKHNQNAKFLAYYFNTATFFKDKKKLAHGTKVIEVTPSTLAKIKIPLPPLPEQQRIVDILDRFDTLCNDISSGLPAEIKARQQQYEYYRDKLLTFKNIAEKET
ncbi:MAG: restriction endonuclease subunit S [Anaerovoracaceae bacterium]